MDEYKLKFANFHKLFFPWTHNSKISTEPLGMRIRFAFDRNFILIRIETFNLVKIITERVHDT